MDDLKNKSDFRCFLQINLNYLLKFIELIKNPVACRVFLFLVFRSDKHNFYDGGPSKLVTDLRIDRMKATTAIKYLNEHGFIRTEKIGNKTVQWINPALIWKTKPEERKLCGFIEDKQNRPIYSFNNFIQLNYKLVMRDMYVTCLIENYRAFNLLFYLLIHMNYRREVEVTKEKISEQTGISVKAVYNYSKYLQDKGYFRIYNVRGVNGYEIYSDIACRGNSDRKAYALFEETEKGGLYYD